MFNLFKSKTSGKIDSIIETLDKMRTQIEEIDKRLAGRERNHAGRHK